MLYLAIPAHNEVVTIGVLLWRVLTVLAEFPREYEVVVYDDASSDETAEVAEQYADAMPVTVLRGTTHVGYAGALDALIRHVSAQTRYPRRDAMMVLQGDFTDPPGIVPEFARRFEGGADLVVGERLVVADAPVPVRRLFKAAHWAMRPFVRVDGVRDLTASMRLIRISALRDLVRQSGSDPVCVGDSWTANADLLLKLVPLARRVESVPLEPTYGVRMRDTRRVAVRDGLASLSWAWRARGRRAVAGSAADAMPEGERRPSRGTPGPKRRDEGEISVEKLRERVRERPRVEDEESFNGRREGRRRERERARADDAEQATPDVANERAHERTIEAAPDKKPERTEPEARPRRERAPRSERAPRGERVVPRSDAPKAPRRGRDDTRSPYSDPTVELDDPFAAPASKRDALDRVFGPGDTLTPGGTAVPAPMPAPESLLPPAPKRDARLRNVDEESDATLADGGIDAEDASIEGDDVDDVDGAESGEAENGDAVDGAAPRKKRRRNRRSRRGRAKREGTGDESADAAASDAASSDVAASDVASDDVIAGAPPRSVSRRPVAVEGDESGAYDADDADASDSAHGDESDEDSAARARRRGRRGRRGGARRSRGRRDKDGSESGESSGDGGDGGEDRGSPDSSENGE